MGWRNRPNPWIHAIEDDGREWAPASNKVLPPQEQESTNADVPWRNLNRPNGKYPVTQYEWRIDGELLPEAYDCHLGLRKEYSTEGVKEMIEKGDALAKAAGSLEQALFQFQEVEFRKLAPHRKFIHDRKALIEEFADEMK